MKPRMLLLIPAALACNMWIFTAGPYAELTGSVSTANLPEQRPMAAAEDIVKMIASLTPEQRALYAEHLVWDLGLIVGNTVILVALIGVAVRLLHLRAPWPVCLLVLATAPGLLDLVENATTAALLARHVTPPPMLASVTSMVVGLKFATLLFALLSAFVLWLLLAVRRLRARARLAMR